MRSEKEKMISGEFYYAFDEELVRDRIRVRRLLQEYNSTKADETEKRLELLGKILKSEGEIIIEPPFYCDYGYNIRAGKNFYANFSCTILDVNPVIIGDNVMFGPNVQIYTATHPLDPEERMKGLEHARGIVIGDNVWLAGGVILCPGVKIGDNTTIGAGSVVTRDIPARVLAAGNPCRVIRSL
ncbi:MAG: sugar O-acetyltransferase [Bacteroidales bacterium]|jgi:maltose O-acetyltransferase|nr:sugar O-acetyltransferase [Bacteroidales bacterium]